MEQKRMRKVAATTEQLWRVGDSRQNSFLYLSRETKIATLSTIAQSVSENFQDGKKRRKDHE
jgi:hypothetical protein